MYSNYNNPNPNQINTTNNTLHNPNNISTKPSPESLFLTAKPMYTSINSLSRSNAIAGITLIIGLLSKIIFPTSKDKSKMSLFIKLIHLPGFLNHNQLLFAGLITLSIFSFVLISYSFIELPGKSFQSILKSTRACYFVKNLVILIVFYLIYDFLYKPISQSTKFRLSGHYLVIIFANFMHSNNKIICENLIQNNFKKSMFIGVKYVTMTFMYLNLYSLILTCWIYHSFQECVISMIISTLYTYIIYILDVDMIVLNIVFPEKKEVGRENVIGLDSSNYEILSSNN